MLLLIAPLKVSMERFWRMVWENKIPTIVMLTKCTEAGKVHYAIIYCCMHVILGIACIDRQCTHAQSVITLENETLWI